MRLLALLVAPVLAVLLSAGALAQPADDEWVDSLVMARDRLDADISLLDGELASIDERTSSDDWYVTSDPREGHEGEFLEIDLRGIDEYEPLARLVARQPSPLAVRLLATLSLTDPRAWTAVSLLVDMDAVRAGASPVEVSAQVPASRRQSADERQRRYAGWRAKVQTERDGLAELRDEIQRELDALGRTEDATPEPDEDDIVLPSVPPTEIEALPSPTPMPSLEAQASPELTPLPQLTPTPEPPDEPSSEPTPGMEPEGIEHDALVGLPHCDDDDPDCIPASPEPVSDSTIVCPGAFADALEAPYTSLSVSEISACFDDCQAWISWHGSMGDVLPEWCTGADPESTPEPSEPPATPESTPLVETPPSPEPSAGPVVEVRSLWDGCWATPWGQLRLDEVDGGRVSGILEWVDAGGDQRRARMELEPLIGEYTDRLKGTLFDGPPTQAIVCPTAAGDTVQWASGRIDYDAMAPGKVFGGSFTPCGDYDAYDAALYSGTWEATLEECAVDQQPEAGAVDASDLAAWEGDWATNLGVLSLSVVRGQLIGEFESGLDNGLSGTQVVLEPDEEEPSDAAGRWTIESGRYECAEEYGVEPGYWGEIWLSRDWDSSLIGGFNYCSERGGERWIIVDWRPLPRIGSLCA